MPPIRLKTGRRVARSMRLTPLLAAVTLVLAAGCTGLEGATGSAGTTGPASPVRGRDWTVSEEDAGPAWVTLSHGCGFCMGATDRPEFTLVALYPDARVMQVEYGLGERDGPALQVATAELEAWRLHLQPLLLEDRPYATETGDGSRRPLKVHGVDAWRLETAAATAVRAEVRAGLLEGGEQAGTIDTTDCGPAIVQAHGSPREGRVEIGCGKSAGTGWSRVLEQLRALEA